MKRTHYKSLCAESNKGNEKSLRRRSSQTGPEPTFTTRKMLNASFRAFEKNRSRRVFRQIDRELSNNILNLMSLRTIAKVAIISLIAWPATNARSGTETNAPISRSASATSQQNERGKQMNEPESNRATKQPPAEPRARTRANAKITVQNSEAKPYDQTASPALIELRLNETFTGDIEGESPVRALEVLRDDHSAHLVSVQRFTGKLGDRKGTFVLQGSETVENGKIKATWFVVPGSGTGELSGLRGEGGFEGQFGKGSNGTLDYWFE